MEEQDLVAMEYFAVAFALMPFAVVDVASLAVVKLPLHSFEAHLLPYSYWAK